MVPLPRLFAEYQARALPAAFGLSAWFRRDP